jgi:hypothetical protein
MSDPFFDIFAGAEVQDKKYGYCDKCGHNTTRPNYWDGKKYPCLDKTCKCPNHRKRKTKSVVSIPKKVAHIL